MGYPLSTAQPQMHSHPPPPPPPWSVFGQLSVVSFVFQYEKDISSWPKVFSRNVALRIISLELESDTTLGGPLRVLLRRPPLGLRQLVGHQQPTVLRSGDV